mgnify:CR=1 FL=1
MSLGNKDMNRFTDAMDNYGTMKSDLKPMIETREDRLIG